MSVCHPTDRARGRRTLGLNPWLILRALFRLCQRRPRLRLRGADVDVDVEIDLRRPPLRRPSVWQANAMGVGQRRPEEEEKEEEEENFLLARDRPPSVCIGMGAIYPASARTEEEA